MKRLLFAACGVAIVGAVVAVQCGGRVLGDGAIVEEPAPSLGSALDTVRAYLGQNTRVALATTHETDAVVDLVAGARVRARVTDDRGGTLAVRVARQRRDGTLEAVALGTAGCGAEEFEASSDGRYAFVLPVATPAVQAAIVDLSCTRQLGRCSERLQPGEVCSAGHLCEEGLYCGRADRSCAATFDTGACMVREVGNTCPDQVLTVAPDASAITLK